MKVATQTVRRLNIIKQHLAGARQNPDKEGVLKIMQDLRCLQIDPIRAVERTQYTVLFSRLGPYPLSLLDTLAYEEKSLFEYWAHAASLVLVEDLPHYKLHMQHAWTGRSKGAWAKRTQEWLDTNQDFLAYVLETIKNKAPVTSSDIEDRSKVAWESGGWSTNQNVSRALSLLWDKGKISVAKRKGTRRYWDLLERCLPAWAPEEVFDWETSVYDAAQKSLKALGAATAKHIKNHFIRNSYPDLDNILKKLEMEKKIIRIDLDGARAEEWRAAGNWYLHTDDIPLVENIQNGDWSPRTALLSPFDNLICDRDRTELMWDFFFRIEIYVPKAKREFGYYVLPILHGDELIGRIDTKMDRKKKTLHIHSVYAEPDTPQNASTGQEVRGAIEDLAAFVGAKSIVYGKVHAAGWQPYLV